MSDRKEQRLHQRLSPEKQRLFQLMLAEKQRSTAGGGDARIQPQQRPKRIPLSLGQEGMWFIDQMGGANLSMPGSVRLQGPLDTVALQRSMTEIRRRHEALRTTIEFEEGQPHQRVSPPTAIELPLTDLSSLPPAERLVEARRRATGAAHAAFDLRRGPLIRGELLRLGADDHVMLLNLHHIIADGWSMGVLTRELNHFYSAYARGREAQLPELAVQYADFALWQQRQLLEGRFADSLSFWERQLRGSAAPVQLPGGSPRSNASSFRGAHLPWTPPPELSSAARDAARAAGVTPFVYLSAAFKLLLHHYTRQTDILIGSTFANRRQHELEELIGYFANTLPIRTDLSGDPTFRELLARMRSTILSVADHQQVPFSRIVQHVQPGRSATGNPFFQIVFDVLTPDRNPAVFGYGLASEVPEQLRICDLTVTPMDVEGGEARFDLAVFVWDMPTGFSGSFEYNADAYAAADIAKVCHHYEALLRLATSHGSERLSWICGQLRQLDQQLTEQHAQQYQRRAKSSFLNAKRRVVGGQKQL